MKSIKYYGLGGHYATQRPETLLETAERLFEQEIARHGYPGVQSFFFKGCAECSRLYGRLQAARKWE